MWQALKTPQETEAEGKLPDYPRVLFRGKRYAKDRWRSASISLDGLLDYDEDVRLFYLSSSHPCNIQAFFTEGFWSLCVVTCSVFLLPLYTDTQSHVKVGASYIHVDELCRTVTRPPWS